MWRRQVSLYSFLGMIFPLPSGLDMVAVNLKVVQLARTVVCSLTLVVWYWVAYKAALLCPHYLFTSSAIQVFLLLSIE